MKYPTKPQHHPINPPLEHQLSQPLSGDFPSQQLAERLSNIPDQFPRPLIEATAHNQHQSYTATWLFPSLATAAAISGISMGLYDVFNLTTQVDLFNHLIDGGISLSGAVL